MQSLDKDEHAADELWRNCLVKYSSQNPLKRFLLNNFFSTIRKIVKKFGQDYRLLEVGCGPGESSRRIAAMLNGRYFEVSDYEERFVRKLRQRRFPFKVTRESIYSLQRRDGEFDCVLLLEVLEHLDDVNLALKELFRVARRYVVISVPHEPIWRIMNMLRLKYLKSFGNTPGHIHHWSPASLKKLIARFGKVKKIYTSMPWIIVLAEKNNDS